METLNEDERRILDAASRDLSRRKSTSEKP
jgi:hypothetical protein